jgi:hypothetical protein
MVSHNGTPLCFRLSSLKRMHTQEQHCFMFSYFLEDAADVHIVVAYKIFNIISQLIPHKI